MHAYAKVKYSYGMIAPEALAVILMAYPCRWVSQLLRSRLITLELTHLLMLWVLGTYDVYSAFPARQLR